MKRLVLASNNARKMKELERPAGAARLRGHSAGAARHSGSRGTALHLRRKRAGQGAPCRQAYRPAGAGRRFRHLRRGARRRARRLFRPLRRRAEIGRAQQCRSCSPNSAGQPQPRAPISSAVIVLVRHADDPQPLIAEGEWHGEILTEPRGERRLRLRPACSTCRNSARPAPNSMPTTKNRRFASRPGHAEADRASAEPVIEVARSIPIFAQKTPSTATGTRIPRFAAALALRPCAVVRAQVPVLRFQFA